MAIRWGLGFRPGPLGEGAQAAAAAGVDVLLICHDETGPVGRDALSVAAWLTATTRDAGLVAEVPASWAPFHVARALASFDLLSGGRCGWSPIRGDIGPEQAAEHLDVVRALFDSWDDDALVLDKATSTFADRAKVRRIRHAGAFYAVDGPLNAPRPPQGHPVLFQPLHEADGLTDVALAPLERLEADAPPCPAARTFAEIALSRRDDPATLADRLLAACEAGLCDGVVLGPREPGADAAWLAETLIPRLKAHPGFAAPPPPGDLRTRLGLPRPGNRHAPTPVPAVMA